MPLPRTLPLCVLALALACPPLLLSGAASASPPPQATPATPAGTPVPFAVTVEDPRNEWPAACSPAAVADTVRRFVDAINHADAAALTALIPEKAMPLEVPREPGSFTGFHMPLPSGILVEASNRDKVLEYARMLEAEGGTIVLTSLALSVHVQWLSGYAEEPTIVLNLGPMGWVKSAGSEPIWFSGKGGVECADPLQVVLWLAGPRTEPEGFLRL